MDSIETTEIEASGPEPTNPLRTLVLQAVARGWCAPTTQHLEMDADLAVAITDQVVEAIIGARGQVAGSGEGLDGLKVPFTTDALAWAEAFLQLYVLKKHAPIGAGAVDDAVGVMLGWFANAIMAGHDRAERRHAARWEKRRLFNEPLGTRFRYINGSADVWVLVSYERSGVVAAWSNRSLVQSDNGRRLQSLCSATESREDFEQLVVEVEVAP